MERGSECLLAEWRVAGSTPSCMIYKDRSNGVGGRECVCECECVRVGAAAEQGGGGDRGSEELCMLCHALAEWVV